MGFLSSLKSFLYQLLVQSRIIYYLYPIILPLAERFLVDFKKNKNHDVVDASGKTIGVCKVNGKLYPAFGVERLKTISDITIRDSDIMLCGYPKTGCHWTFEILTMLVTGKPKLSKYGKGPVGMIEAVPDFMLDSVPSPRVLNSHVLFEELPHQIHTNKTKIIFTVRNPKDTVVSFYNHTKNLLKFYDYKGEFDDFFKLFMSGGLEYGSYFDYTLSWDEHIKKPTTNEILLLKFEDMKAHPIDTVKRLAKFINVEITDEFAQEVYDAANFNKMKKKGDSAFFRKGQVGDWRNWLTDDQSAAIDRVWQQRMTRCTYQPHYNNN